MNTAVCHEYRRIALITSYAKGDWGYSWIGYSKQCYEDQSLFQKMNSKRKRAYLPGCGQSARKLVAGGKNSQGKRRAEPWTASNCEKGLSWQPYALCSP